VQQGQLTLSHVQADEIRVKGKKGIMWMGLAREVSSRLWLAGVVQTSRDHVLADRLLQQVRRCACRASQLLICVDGWAAYVRRVGVSEIPVKHGRGREQEPLGQELTRRGNSKGTVACS
jgi:transposase-like protein